MTLRTIYVETGVTLQSFSVVNASEIGQGAIVSTLSLITEGTVVPPYTYWKGVPAQQAGALPDDVDMETAPNYSYGSLVLGTFQAIRLNSSL